MAVSTGQTTTISSLEPPSGDGRPSSRRRVRPVTVLLILIVIAMAVMWIYAFFFADRTSPDRLGDRSWAAKTEVICARYRAEVRALPPASSFQTVKPVTEALRQRADVGDRSNVLLTAMVAEIRGLGPAVGDTEAVAGWLKDWDTHIADRSVQIGRWRQGIDRQLAETEDSGGVPISKRMDGFTDINQMPSCKSPQDVA